MVISANQGGNTTLGSLSLNFTQQEGQTYMINTMLAKLSSDGDWQWASTSNTSDYSWAVAIGTTASGGIVLVGGQTGTTTFGAHSVSHGEYQVFAAVANDSGAWTQADHIVNGSPWSSSAWVAESGRVHLSANGTMWYHLEGDFDDDGDGVQDSTDLCQAGALGWASDASTDHDSDGCQDSGEDADDDNDSVEDALDSCPSGRSDGRRMPRQTTTPTAARTRGRTRTTTMTGSATPSTHAQRATWSGPRA